MLCRNDYRIFPPIFSERIFFAAGFLPLGASTARLLGERGLFFIFLKSSFYFFKVSIVQLEILVNNFILNVIKIW